MTKRESLFIEAIGLPEAERELLALELNLSLEKDPRYEDAWAPEFKRRRGAH